LLHEVIHEVAGQNLGVARDVINRLLGINLGELPARLGQGVYHVATQLEESGFKNSKQAHRASPDDADISGNYSGHSGGKSVSL
jgi:hypothetical protein